MYEQRFRLQRRPFPATPDQSCWYPATGHERALHLLERGLAEGEGFLLLTGLSGTGKSLLAHRLCERLGEDTVATLWTHGRLQDRASLYQAILFDLQLPFEGASEQVLRLRLLDYLLENCAAGKRFVLVFDEAHHLDLDLLEELRLLGNLEAGGKKAFQVVLFGLPDLAQRLRQPGLSPMAQRIGAPIRLEPLELQEALDYLLHHLRLAGGSPEKILDEAALEVLARGTHGIPRLLNQAAQQALLLADAADLERIDAEAALEALHVIGLGEGEDGDAAGENPAAAPTFRLAEDTRRTA